MVVLHAAPDIGHLNESLVIVCSTRLLLFNVGFVGLRVAREATKMMDFETLHIRGVGLIL